MSRKLWSFGHRNFTFFIVIMFSVIGISKPVMIDKITVSDSLEPIVSIYAKVDISEKNYKGRIECRRMDEESYKYQKRELQVSEDGNFNDHIHPFYVLRYLEDVGNNVLVCRIYVFSESNNQEYYSPEEIILI